MEFTPGKSRNFLLRAVFVYLRFKAISSCPASRLSFERNALTGDQL